MVKRSDSDFKEGYKNANFDDSDKLYQQAELIIRSLNSLGNFQISSNFEGEYSKIADQLLKEGKNSGKLKYAVYGAKIYELLGKGEKNFVLNNLLNAVNSQKGNIDVELLDWVDYFRARHHSNKFPKDLVPEGNPEPVFGDPKYLEYKKRKEKMHELNAKSLEKLVSEKKILNSIFGVFALVGIFFSISSMTGAVIGFSNSFSIPFGIGLFVVGIFGLSFGNKL